MVSPQTLDLARQAADELRRRGEVERANAIEALVNATDRDAIGSPEPTAAPEVGELIGASGQAIREWVREGRVETFRVGGRFDIPREVVAEYIRRAGQSIDLDELSDEEAVDLVAESRSRNVT